MNLKKILAKLKFEQIPTTDGAAVLEVDGEIAVGKAVKVTTADGTVLDSGEFVVLYNGKELKIVVEGGKIVDVVSVEPTSTETQASQGTQGDTVQPASVAEFESFANALIDRLKENQKEIIRLRTALSQLTDEVNKLKLQTHNTRKSAPVKEFMSVEELRKKFNL